MISVENLKDQIVLFAEDDELAKEKMTKYLDRLFKKVITASNGLDGFEKFQQAFRSDEKIDLIISDINMPIMDGLEMLEHIREIDLELPIIFTTARSEVEHILKAIDLNVSAYILKPIDTTVLLDKLLGICEKRYIHIQLDEKQHELKRYLEAVDHVALIYKMDENGHITFANKSMLETSKYSLEELEKINFDGLIHPDIPKIYIDETWEIVKKDEIWSGNTKFITKDKDSFYLKNTIFKLKTDNKTEYITIGFSTTKEHIEKREFHKKVIKNIQEFNKKEFKYKKLIEDLLEKNKQLEAYIPRLQTELEEQKAKTQSRQRQLDHYELQMFNVDEKYHGHMSTKSKEAEEYSKTAMILKQEKSQLLAKLKELKDEVAAQQKEIVLLMETNEQKNKRIDNLNDVIKTLEGKIKDILEKEEH